MGAHRRAEITMDAEETAAFLEASRTATLATVGPDGAPHLVAMWFAVLDGAVWFETKAKSQKALNLRRNSRASCMVEAGLTYDTLRGVSLEGHGVLVEDPAALWRVGVSLWERYTGPYEEQARPLIAQMLHKRVAIRLEPERTRTWDHRKLALSPVPLGGTTV